MGRHARQSDKDAPWFGKQVPNPLVGIGPGIGFIADGDDGSGAVWRPDEDDDRIRFDVRESQVRDYLHEHWKSTLLNAHWVQDERSPEVHAGKAGRMDLFAKSKNGKTYLVVEIKRYQADVNAYYQVVRYMEWVQRNRKDAKKVIGYLIAESADSDLRSKLRLDRSVHFYSYRIDVSLKRRTSNPWCWWRRQIWRR